MHSGRLTQRQHKGKDGRVVAVSLQSVLSPMDLRAEPV